MKGKLLYKPTISEAILLILENIAEGTLKQCFPHPYYHTFCEHTLEQSFRNALQRMHKKHFIRKRYFNGESIYSLAPEGMAKARILKIKIEMTKKRKWDGKWRIILFDVREKSRRKRWLLRQELTAMGFLMLQKSAWIIPYQLPSAFAEFIKEFMDDIPNEDIRILEINSINPDKDIYNFFFHKNNDQRGVGAKKHQ